jgi:hypothetical protein
MPATNPTPQATLGAPCASKHFQTQQETACSSSTRKHINVDPPPPFLVMPKHDALMPVFFPTMLVAVLRILLPISANRTIGG